jgi:hypothetical protein
MTDETIVFSGLEQDGEVIFPGEDSTVLIGGDTLIVIEQPDEPIIGLPSDEVTFFVLEENVGLPGPPGPPGPAGRDGIASGVRPSLVYSTPQASTVWEVSHDFPFVPNVIVTDSTGEVVYPDVTYPAFNLVRIEFASPCAGFVYLS